MNSCISIYWYAMVILAWQLSVPYDDSRRKDATVEMFREKVIPLGIDIKQITTHWPIHTHSRTVHV